eukprot:9268929-Pyramimonas_sp.AAC.1
MCHRAGFCLKSCRPHNPMGMHCSPALCATRRVPQFAFVGARCGCAGTRRRRAPGVLWLRST